ncbi:MAG: protein phosphatase 2C domain-containing protein [Bacteroidaceae bacterium]|nr:protein phosphatase 2C domain-containing protein [Bacteroidaceae bacterium]
MKYKLLTYSIQELGQRQNQEDSIFPNYEKSTAEDRIFILCDGMGGHEKGEVASATVCEVMSQTILSRWNTNEPLSDDLLLQAIEEAYDALDTKDNGEAKKMGTTMTFLCFHSEGATVAHIGDSRVYQLRPTKGDEPARVVFRTRDHSLVNDLIKIGEITEEEAKNHPQKNVITRAMQPCQERRSKADIAHITDIQPGDYFYMCSDGMLEQTSDENLLYIITKENTTNEQKVEMLREVTADNKDNHTAHLIYIKEVNDVLKKEDQIIAHNPSSPEKNQGTWIYPEEEAPKKSKLPIYAIIVLLILAIAGGAYYYFSIRPSDTTVEVNDSDSIKAEQKEDVIITSESTKESSQKTIDDNADTKKTAVEENAPSTTNEEEIKNEETENSNTSESHNSKSHASKFIPTKKRVDNKDKEQETSKQ